jgi:hypothetical protein
MDAESQQLLDFLELRAPDAWGRMLEEILLWPDQKIESVHTHIQWMFPLYTRSGFKAPILNDELAAKITASPVAQGSLKRAFLRMLDFCGLEYADGEVRESSQFVDKSRNWLDLMNHNFLRLTRMMISLAALGQPEEAKALQAYLLPLAEGRSDIIPEKTRQFWLNAV